MAFEFRKAAGQEISIRKVHGLVADLALETRRAPIRLTIEDTVRFELPLEKSERSFVPIKPLLEETMARAGNPVTYLFGRKHDGSPFELPVTQALHMLVAGQTGGGKSVLLHSLIAGLVFRYPPSAVRLALYDHKIEEFSRYRDLPHLWLPVVTDEAGLSGLLENLNAELARRKRARAKDRRQHLAPIITIMDEFRGISDPKLVSLIAEARSLNMYFILATQHPTADVISTSIKANLVTGVALRVRNSTESRLIIGLPDAESLLPHGDCLVNAPTGVTRIQAAWCRQADLEALAAHLEKPDRKSASRSGNS
jgi:S-DNA-T family DNA segregation ATPase FtsK/SpoIIIE